MHTEEQGQLHIGLDVGSVSVDCVIIDEYHYCQPMGKSAKAQLVVNKFLTFESFAGGVFAIANKSISNRLKL